MLFNITTYLEKNTPEELDEDDNRVFDQDNEHEWDPEDITLSNHLHIAAFAQVNYFEMADMLASGCFPNAPKPHWTFSTATSTFHFVLKPSLWLSIDDAAAKFNLPDLPLALYEYQHYVEGPSPHTVLGARSYAKAHNLPFEHIQIWCKIHIQQMCYHDKTPDAPQTLQVIPPSTDNPYGLYDAVIVNATPQSSWPKQGLDGRSLSNFCSPLLTYAYRPLDCPAANDISSPPLRQRACLCTALQCHPPMWTSHSSWDWYASTPTCSLTRWQLHWRHHTCHIDSVTHPLNPQLW